MTARGRGARDGGLPCCVELTAVWRALSLRVGGSGASAPLLTEAIGYVHYGPKTAFINGSAVWLSGKDLCGT